MTFDSHPLGEQLNLIGKNFLSQNQPQLAAAAFVQALQYPPINPEIYLNLGNTYESQGHLKPAISIYQQAITDFPNYPLAFINLGVTCIQLGNPTQAESYFRQALKLDRKNPIIHNNLGNLYKSQGRLNQASDSYLKALELDPTNASFYYNLGNVFQTQGRLEEALTQYLQAMQYNPRDAEIHDNLATTLKSMGQHQLALKHYKKAVRLNPNSSNSLANLVSQLREVASWSSLSRHTSRLSRLLEQELTQGIKPGVTPFLSLIFSTDQNLQLQVAKSWSQYTQLRLAQIPSFTHPVPNPKIRKIKLGFLSDEFGDFPTTHCLIGVMEHLDPRQFSVHLYHYGAIGTDAFTTRLAQTNCRLVDIANLDLVAAAKKIHSDGIHLLVDLKGHSNQNRMDILALRPAPVQISWLGYPGTTGADFIDYQIVDHTVVPSPAEIHFSESLVFLPHSYRPTDDQAKFATTKPTRKTENLPKKGFIFASFHHSYQLQPQLFHIWLQLLNSVDHSYLWLYPDNELAIDNLRTTAQKAGLSSDRLIFASPVDRPTHLARLRLADLFLDTYPINGHTAVVDALWAEVPVIALRGPHFASQVSQSSLTALGLSELVTPNLKAYLKLAHSLATKPQKLHHLRRRLHSNRSTMPLFNTKQFTRNLEKAFHAIWQRHVENKSPISFSVDSLDP